MKDVILYEPENGKIERIETVDAALTLKMWVTWIGIATAITAVTNLYELYKELRASGLAETSPIFIVASLLFTVVAGGLSVSLFRFAGRLARFAEQPFKAEIPGLLSAHLQVLRWFSGHLAVWLLAALFIFIAVMLETV